jgi:hypothetical protein
LIFAVFYNNIDYKRMYWLLVVVKPITEFKFKLKKWR